MERQRTNPRDGWQQKIAEAGLIFNNESDSPYWQEEAYYEFSAREVDDLEEATNTLHDLCLAAAAHVIDRDRLAELAIPAPVAALIKESWRQERDFTLYGRFDLAYDGDSPPKLLEYNADTPTMLLEAAVVQWHWLEEKFRGADQFNSIHERLLDQWNKLKWYLRHSPLYFTYAEGSLEDLATVSYLMDTAAQAGLETADLLVSDIGWHRERRQFVDLARAAHPEHLQALPLGVARGRRSSAPISWKPIGRCNGWNPSGSWSFPPRGFCPSSGSSTPGTPTSWRPRPRPRLPVTG